MSTQPATVVTYVTEPPVVTVVKMETVEDLQWLKEALDEGSLYARGVGGTQINTGKLVHEEFYSTYGDSVDSRFKILAMLGSFVGWNQSKRIYVGSSSNVSAFPSDLFEPVITES